MLIAEILNFVHTDGIRYGGVKYVIYTTSGMCHHAVYSVFECYKNVTDVNTACCIQSIDGKLNGNYKYIDIRLSLGNLLVTNADPI